MCIRLIHAVLKTAVLLEEALKKTLLMSLRVHVDDDDSKITFIFVLLLAQRGLQLVDLVVESL